MQWYQVKLKVESWLASVWQSDTIWGHLCWALTYNYGEDALLSFIDAYEQGSPLLLVSNGFPGELLPRPVVPEPEPHTRQEFAQWKEAKGTRFLTNEEFARAIRGEEFVPSQKREELERMVTLKNQINRLTSTTGAGGQLFSFEQWRWALVSIYLKVADSFVDRARELFGHLAESGYGKRKTVGYGQISLEAFTPFPGFSSPADSNGFVTLSNFIPAANDPKRGYWDVLVKYGKLGEEFATGDNPFKTPLVMLSAGSCFYDSPCREYYGRLVNGVSSRPEQIVQYAFALPVPIRLPIRDRQ